MSEEGLMFEACDRLVREFEAVIERPVKEPSAVYYTGVDLGTACVVLAVLDEHFRPVAGAFRYADVVRAGMVVDYIGAIRIVRELKEELDRVNGMLREEYLDQPGLKRNRLYDILPEEVIRQMREAAGEDKKD